MASLKSTVVTGTLEAGDGSNTTVGAYSTSVGGCANFSCGACSVIVGGYCNCTNGAYAGNLGGVCNKTAGSGASTTGGLRNCAVGSFSSVIGGVCGSIVSGNCSTIIGGYLGCICNNSHASTIVGGSSNAICNGTSSVVLGGTTNKLYSAHKSVILGGNGVVECRSCFITTGCFNRTTSIDIAKSQMFIEKVYVQGGTDVGSVQGNYVHYGNTAVYHGGYSPNKNMSYMKISTPGNGASFGTMIDSRQGGGAVSNGVRGVMMGGYCSSSLYGCYINTIEYITFSSPGAGTNWGSTTITKRGKSASASNGVRGVMMGGACGVSGYKYSVSTIDYVTVSIPGSIVCFGELTSPRHTSSGSSNGVKGFSFGGMCCTGVYTSHIDAVTISTPSNSSTFGALCFSCTIQTASADNGVKVVSKNDGSVTNLHEWTMNSSINSTQFGNLHVSENGKSGTSNGVKGVFGGGYCYSGSSCSSSVHTVNIGTPGDLTYFGALSYASQIPSVVTGD